MNRSEGFHPAVSSFVPVALLLAVSFLAAASLGAEHINFIQMLHPDRMEDYQKIILFRIRLPRVILALLAGMLLAGSGAVFQLFFRNALAEPGIMGISAGATLGAVISGFVGPGIIGIISIQSLGAFAGALCAALVVTILSAVRKDALSASVTLLLCGTALGTLYSSFSSIIILLNEKILHGMFVWMLGSFNGKTWTDFIFIAFPAAMAMILLLFCSHTLDLLAGGELTARSLGLEIKTLRLLVIAGGSLAVSVSVCAGGTIGFVGLIAPHIVRRMYGAKSRILVPLSMLWGGVIMLLSDTVARVIVAPAELPVGIVTSILGAPFFISLIVSTRGIRNA
jgi:iron complex transport system permease protein